MILKSHVNQDGQKIVAIIDDDLLGHIFENDDLLLDFTSAFYQGVAVDPAEIRTHIRDAYMLNCAGEQTVRFLKEERIISDADINIIEGVPYVYVLFSED